MIYETNITVPANTPQNDKQRNDLNLTSGVMHFLEIHFPPGCCNLVHVSINLGGVQIFPSTNRQDIAGDTIPVRFEDYYPLKPSHHKITIYTWSEDDTYNHTIRIRAGVLKAERVGLAALWDWLGETITGSSGSPLQTGQIRRL